MNMQNLLIEQAAIEYAEMFENLTPDSIDRFNTVFDSGARFCDPFNDVTGVDNIRHVFEHMYEVCNNPRFEVVSLTTSGPVSWLLWNFYFRIQRRDMKITGVSMVKFNNQGKVIEHTDYWDAASQLYEYLPVVGWLVKKLRRQFATPVITGI